MKTALVLGITSDIGRALADRLLADGWQVIGLGREVSRIASLPNLHVYPFEKTGIFDHGAGWDLLISAIGTMKPIGRFFDLGFDDWQRSIDTNFLLQLRLLHRFWPHRRVNAPVDIMFMAGGGTNGPFRNYSAYCVSKIALIKMCELIHDEEPDANCFIIGPGYVNTKIHRQTLDAGECAGDNLRKTQEFLETLGTPMDDIYTHMRWCVEQGRQVAGGRNFSTVHDPWRTMNLQVRLRRDEHMYRLRRSS